jgi:hypothetical protein
MLSDLARFLESRPFLFAVFTTNDVSRAAEKAKPVTPTRRAGSAMLSLEHVAAALLR